MLEHLSDRLANIEVYVDLEEFADPIFWMRHDAGAYDQIARNQVVSASRALRADTCRCETHMLPVITGAVRQLRDAARRIRTAAGR
jgi:hypothetical protein